MQMGWILAVAASLSALAIAPSAASSREPAKAARDMQPHNQPASCPLQLGTELTGIEVYDGPFADRAILKPEESSARTGYWELGYIYKIGRTVNLRCSYRDGRIVDHELRQSVDFCRYRDFADGRTALSCR